MNFTLLCLLVSAFFLKKSAFASQLQVSEQFILGGNRPAKLIVPTKKAPQASLPLVVFLHGYTSTSQQANAYFQLEQKAQELQFALLLPDGTKNSKEYQFWNATPECCDFEKTGVNDALYLEGLILEAKTVTAIQSESVFVAGHSNGGFMSYRMACEYPRLFKGIISISGAFFKETELCKPQTFELSKTLNILQIHGNKDNVVPYEGNTLFPGVLHGMDFWRKHNKCRVSQSKNNALDLVLSNKSQLPKLDTNILEWNVCEDGKRMALWTIKGTEHVPQFNSNWLELALEFVSK